MLHKLYTYGYSGRTPHKLQTLAKQLEAVVADIRFSPRSRIPDWSGGRLQKLLGDRYRHLPALGNRNYKGGPVEFVDLAHRLGAGKATAVAVGSIGTMLVAVLFLGASILWVFIAAGGAVVLIAGRALLNRQISGDS